MSVEVGETYRVACPFIRTAFEDYDEGGVFKSLSWEPGIKWEVLGEDASARSHGVGSVEYTVISRHKPPHPYPARIFFTRKWVAPDGKKFGTSRLRIMTEAQFKTRIRSYISAGVDRWTKFVCEDLSHPEISALLGQAEARAA